MSKQIFSHRSQSAYTLGKYLNLLPFELFNHVKAGRLHPVDENTGLPIPRPDVSKIKRRLEAIEQEIKVLPLAYGKLQTGIVIVKGLSLRYTIDQEKQRLDGLSEKLQKEQGSLKEKLKAITATDDWTTYDPPENRQNDFDILQNARFHNDEIRRLNIETSLDSPGITGNVTQGEAAPIEATVGQVNQDNHVTHMGSAPTPLTPTKETKEFRADQNKSLPEIPAKMTVTSDESTQNDMTPKVSEPLTVAIPEAETPKKGKQESRSSKDKKRTIDLAITLMKNDTNKTRQEVAVEIKEFMKNKYTCDTIKSWIGHLFPPELKKQGRPKKISTRKV